MRILLKTKPALKKVNIVKHAMLGKKLTGEQKKAHKKPGFTTGLVNVMRKKEILPVRAKFLMIWRKNPLKVSIT